MARKLRTKLAHLSGIELPAAHQWVDGAAGHPAYSTSMAVIVSTARDPWGLRNTRRNLNSCASKAANRSRSLPYSAHNGSPYHGPSRMHTPLHSPSMSPAAFRRVKGKKVRLSPAAGRFSDDSLLLSCARRFEVSQGKPSGQSRNQDPVACPGPTETQAKLQLLLA